MASMSLAAGGAWTKKADIPTARYALSASVVDGIIYAIGGSHGWDGSMWPGISTVEAYDPLTDTWIKKADMSTARGWLCTGVVEGKIYAIGGARKLFTADDATLPTVEEYIPEGWQPTAVSPQGKLTATWGEIKRSR